MSLNVLHQWIFLQIEHCIFLRTVKPLFQKHGLNDGFVYYTVPFLELLDR